MHKIFFGFSVGARQSSGCHISLFLDAVNLPGDPIEPNVAYMVQASEQCIMSASGANVQPANLDIPVGAPYVAWGRSVDPVKLLKDKDPISIYRLKDAASSGSDWDIWHTNAAVSVPIGTMPSEGVNVVKLGTAATINFEQLKTDDIRYYHGDHLGSASCISDRAGNLVEETVFYPFGHPRYRYTPNGRIADYTYTQKEQDFETGLFYFEARYMASHLGRFISVDPMGWIDGPNVYAYVRGNPYIYVDPTGLGIMPWNDGVDEGAGSSEIEAPEKKINMSLLEKNEGPVYVQAKITDSSTLAMFQFKEGPSPLWDYETFRRSNAGEISASLKETLFKVEVAMGAYSVYKLPSTLAASTSRVNVSKRLPGPRLPSRIADTFEDGVYVNRKLMSNETFFKYHGVNNRTGRQYTWFTKKKYATESELRAKLAIREDWGVQLESVTEFNVPAGTWVGEGKAAAQGAGYPGQDYQAVVSEVPKAWIIRTDPAFK